MKTLVFNGWAAGLETWDLCAFQHDYIFSYLEGMAGLPAQVMDDTERAILVGFSMGGTFAMREFLRRPEKVCGLVLVSSTPRMMADPTTNWRGLSERRLAALRMGTGLVYKDNPSPLYEPGNLDRGLRELHDVDLRGEIEAFSNTPFAQHLPVRILQSERDGIVLPHNAEWYRRHFPRSRVAMIPGNEHVVPVKAPEAVDAAVAAILEEIKDEA